MKPTVPKPVRVITGGQNIDLKSEKMDKILDFAESRDLPVAFHTGELHTAMKQFGRHTISNLVKADDLEEIIGSHPKIHFILCHLGKPYIAETIRTVKKYQNAYADMSGLLNSYDEAALIPEFITGIRRFLQECGPARLLFGTDFPVQSHKDSVYMIEEAMKDFSIKDKKDVYYNNANSLLPAKLSHIENSEGDNHCLRCGRIRPGIWCECENDGEDCGF